MGTYRVVGISGRRRSCHHRWALSLVPGCRRRRKPGWVRAAWRAGIALGALVACVVLAEPTIRACTAPRRPKGRYVPSTAGRLRSRAELNPSFPVGPGPPAEGRQYVLPAAGRTCKRAHHPASLEITGASSMISTSSRDSFLKAIHMATSSQESRGPCSKPVASSTMV